MDSRGHPSLHARVSRGGLRAPHVVAILLVSSALHGVASAQALPEPPDVVVAKAPYLALVKAMREDETVLRNLTRQIESERHSYKAECVANLRPGLLTATIAWALEPSISAQEVAEATRFFESETGRKLIHRATDAAAPALTAGEELEVSRFTKSEAGDKLLVKGITRQARVLLSAKAELLDLLNTCTETLDGTRQIRYCQSEWVASDDNACSARYEITGRSGEAARATRVSLYCKFPGSDLSSLLTELPGQHATIGLHWRENRTLELLLPPSITPLYTQTGYVKRGLKYEYRLRKPGDPPAAPCDPTAPVDEFGWPAS
jgi:hypothetical protein